ncbi:MAG TPA: hypothetical protein VKT77_22795 [Chthonomonadaceae bacterium]|nr:hypothetical protein [Chthonomonadaceae bacterium]
MTLRLRPYPAYKESGLPWLGAIPAHWELRRTKHLFDERAQKGFPDEPLLAATQTKGVVSKGRYESRTVTAQKDLHLLKLVEAGDYVISLRSFQGGIEYAHDRGIISPAYTILKPSTKAIVKRDYYEFFFKSQTFIDSLTLFGTGIREGQNIDYERLSRSPLPVPPAEEQAAIGPFLRQALGKANRLIRAKRRLIELLTEQKQAIIHHAVTRGLDPDAPLKPSGIDWLGDVPAHWEVVRLKQLLRSIDQGISPQAESRLADDTSWGVLKAGCANRGEFRESEHKRLPDGLLFDTKLQVRIGDVLVSRASGSPQLVGSVARVRSLRYKLVLSDKTFRLAFKKTANADYMVLAMNSRYYRQQVDGAISGAEGLANNLPVSALRTFAFAVPPTDEQRRILMQVQGATGELSSTVERAQREIDLLREYRTRLIADVVTGKLDVRGAALPDLARGAEWDCLGEGAEEAGGETEEEVSEADGDE